MLKMIEVAENIQQNEQHDACEDLYKTKYSMNLFCYIPLVF
mgnify:FL=1